MLELEIRMPPKITTPKMMRRAGELRQNQTEAESQAMISACLGTSARSSAFGVAGVQFRRQYAIGNYIVDAVRVHPAEN